VTDTRARRSAAADRLPVVPELLPRGRQRLTYLVAARAEAGDLIHLGSGIPRTGLRFHLIEAGVRRAHLRLQAGGIGLLGVHGAPL